MRGCGVHPRINGGTRTAKGVGKQDGMLSRKCSSDEPNSNIGAFFNTIDPKRTSMVGPLSV